MSYDSTLPENLGSYTPKSPADSVEIHEMQAQIIAKQQAQLKTLLTAVFKITRGGEFSEDEIQDWLAAAALEDVESECHQMTRIFENDQEELQFSAEKLEVEKTKHQSVLRNIEKLSKTYLSEDVLAKIPRFTYNHIRF